MSRLNPLSAETVQKLHFFSLGKYLSTAKAVPYERIGKMSNSRNDKFVGFVEFIEFVGFIGLKKIKVLAVNWS